MLVRFQRITKRFPGVVALRDVNVDVVAGSCHALMGENGAGKSTLGKILAGIHAPDEGELLVAGKSVRFHSPRDAMAAGIGMVHQELAFCENLTVAENLCLGRLPARGPFVSKREMHRQARERLAAIQSTIDVRRRVGELPVSQQQLVQIAAAVSQGARILIFDEPTSSLSQRESEHLFDLIKHLQAQGVTAIYVSHRLEEIFRLCDTITVLRDGQHVVTRPARELNRDTLVQLMIGRKLDAYFPGHLQTKPGEELLKVENLSSPGKFADISFTLRAGEVLGMAGLVGAGRTEIAEALFGLDTNVTGQVRCGHEIGLVPEDRKRHGLVLSMNARENMSLPTLRRFWINSGQERALAKEYFDRLRVKAPSMDTIVAGLSGGNQQKVVLAKWLAARCRVLIVDEPTRGVDVGAKAEIHGLIDELANAGSGVLLISSELTEVINLSTRILVLREGRLVGEVTREQATQESLMKMMAGIADSQRRKTMPKYEKFEDLPVWKEAARLYNLVLDLLERPGLPLSPGFRNQLDRAALSVSNNIAEGFERVTTGELLAFLAIARGSAGEVRSMIAVVSNRAKLAGVRKELLQIRATAESCARQLTAWTGSIEDSPVQGKRHLTAPQKEARETKQKAMNFRQQFLRNLKSDHPLYNTAEARAARGEPVEDE